MFAGLRWLRATIVLTLLACAQPLAARPTDAAVAEFFDSHVSAQLREAGVPGAALVVVRDGKVLLSKGYGFADLAREEPLSATHHLLRQGSISKLATWIMVMQLVESGKLDLDRDVNAYLQFRIPPAFGKPVTMRHLLTHSAGFGERFIGIFGRPQADLCQTVADNLPPRVSAPGTRVSYSNSGAALAACIVERLGGKDFQALSRERVLGPAGMAGSTFAQPPAPPLRNRLATFYGASTDQPHSFETIAVAPAGSLSASAEDMGRLLASFMNEGEGERSPILRPSTLRQMTSLQLPLAPGLRSGMGLGFIVREHRGVRYVGHGGTMAAAITDLQMLPEHGLGWYIGMNGLGTGGAAVDIRESLPRAVIDRFYAEPRQPVARGPSTAAEAAGFWLPARRYRSGPLKMSDVNLIGVSSDAAGNLFIDSVRDDDGNPRRWVPQGRDRFADSATGTPLVLVRNEDGKVVRFASAAANAVTDFERAPRWMPAALPLLGASSAVILAAVLAIPIAWLWRRARRRLAAPLSNAQGRWRMAARGALLFLFLTLFGWLTFIAIVSDDPYKLASAGLWIAVLGSLAILAPLAALVLAAYAFVALRRGRWSGRIGRVIVALAGVCLAALFYSLGLTGTSLNF